MALPTFDERVRNMASVLDEKRPGWRGLIDVDRIDFDSTTDCTLGQVYGSFNNGLIELGRLHDVAWQVLHAVELPEDEREGLGSYGALTDAWKRYLKDAA